MSPSTPKPKPQPGEMPELRQLTEPELEELHEARKVLERRLIWRSANEAATISQAAGTLRVLEPDLLSFRVQSVMNLTLKIILPARPKRLNFFYRVRATDQIVRMYHSDPGHDDLEGRIDGPHKHRFPERWVRRGYAVNGIPSAINRAIPAFFEEENVDGSAGFEPFAADTRMEAYE